MTTKTISRTDFAVMMSEAIMNAPTKGKQSTEVDDQRFNDWLRASDVLFSVGEPFATCQTIAELPAEIVQTIKSAMTELNVARII